MLNPAYYFSPDEINKLIYQEDCKYLNFNSYNTFNEFESFAEDEWHKIQRVSVSEDGKRILGIFTATLCQIDRSVSGLYLVKFKKNFEYNFGNPHYDKSTAKKDLDEFIEMLVNSPRIDQIRFMAIQNNPANRLYEEWMEKYNGVRNPLPKYTVLKDGFRYNAWQYILDVDKGVLRDYGSDNNVLTIKSKSVEFMSDEEIPALAEAMVKNIKSKEGLNK